MGESTYFQLLNPMMLGLFAGAFHLIGRYDRRGVAHLLFVAYALGAVGFTLDFFVRDALGPFLGSYVSNVPFLASCAVLAMAMFVRYGKEPPWAVAAALALGTLLLMTVFIAQGQTGTPRALVMNVGAGLQFALALFAFRKRSLPSIDRLLLGLFAVSALQFILRPLALFAYNGGGDDSLSYSDSLYALLLHLTTAVVAMSIAAAPLVALGTELVGRLNDAVRSDPLTGLLNRRGLEEAAAAHRGEAAEMRLASVVIADIDHFKSVNDRFGHAAGDVVINAFGRVLEGTARRLDLVARVGGEEFVVVLPGTRPEVARLFAEGVRVAFGEMRLDATGHAAITASFGVAEWRTNQALNAAIDAADAALYAAKNGGRNRVLVADVDPSAEFIQPTFVEPRRTARA